MKALVEMFVFSPWLHQNCPMTSRFAVATQRYYNVISSFQLCINQFANKSCREGDKIGLVGLAETQHYFFRPLSDSMKKDPSVIQWGIKS